MPSMPPHRHHPIRAQISPAEHRRHPAPSHSAHRVATAQHGHRAHSPRCALQLLPVPQHAHKRARLLPAAVPPDPAVIPGQGALRGLGLEVERGLSGPGGFWA
ncbi:hypothetical protein PZA11_001010 [Diplocarpon coronariae]